MIFTSKSNTCLAVCKKFFVTLLCKYINNAKSLKYFQFRYDIDGGIFRFDFSLCVEIFKFDIFTLCRWVGHRWNVTAVFFQLIALLECSFSLHVDFHFCWNDMSMFLLLYAYAQVVSFNLKWLIVWLRSCISFHGLFRVDIIYRVSKSLDLFLKLHTSKNWICNVKWTTYLEREAS